MTIVYDVVDPMELTAFVRELDPRDYGFTLDRYLPNQSREDVEYAFTRVDERREEATPYRAFDAEAAVGSRPGFARVRGQIPPLSKKLPLGEEQRLRLQQMRGANPDIAAQIFDDAAILTESTLARIELARGEALTSGKVTFANDAGFVDVEIDYGAADITAGTALSNGDWDVPGTATPIIDVLQWTTDYQDANNGRDPAVLVMDRVNAQNMLATDEVKTALYPSAGIGRQFPSLSDLSTFLVSRGAPPVEVINQKVQSGGSAVSVLAGGATACYMWPDASVANFGETTFGVTAESLESASAGYGSVGSAPGLFGTTMKTFDPVQLWTKVSGLAIPVVKDCKKILASPVVR